MLNNSNLIDRIRLPFRKEKELFSAIYEITGFYPRNIEYFKLALMHRSVSKRNAKGRPLNNERLEFLGDAILDAVVGDIVYRHFDGKRRATGERQGVHLHDGVRLKRAADIPTALPNHPGRHFVLAESHAARDRDFVSKLYHQRVLHERAASGDRDVFAVVSHYAVRERHVAVECRVVLQCYCRILPNESERGGGIAVGENGIGGHGKAWGFVER